MEIRFAKPDLRLAPYIERYWSWEYEGNVPFYLPNVPPGVSADLYLHYKKPFEINDFGSLKHSHLICSKDKASKIKPATQIGFIAVRFRCGMFGNFSSVPVHQFAEPFIDTSTIWNVAGKDLEEQIGTAKNMEERVMLLDTFLLRQLNKNYNPGSDWRAIVNTLYYHHDEVKLNQLAQQMKITPRHFRRTFYEINGISPKHFQQLSRFHAVLKQLLMTRNSDYLSIVLDKGYFDQMHFIKEFKKFMNTTPSEFLNSNNFQSHFYYDSIK